MWQGEVRSRCGPSPGRTSEEGARPAAWGSPTERQQASVEGSPWQFPLLKRSILEWKLWLKVCVCGCMASTL